MFPLHVKIGYFSFHCRQQSNNSITSYSQSSYSIMDQTVRSLKILLILFVLKLRLCLHPLHRIFFTKAIWKLHINPNSKLIWSDCNSNMKTFNTNIKLNRPNPSLEKIVFNQSWNKSLWHQVVVVKIFLQRILNMLRHTKYCMNLNGICHIQLPKTLIWPKPFCCDDLLLGDLLFVPLKEMNPCNVAVQTDLCPQN